HWSGIRNSVKAIVAPPGARGSWREIKTRFNPTFASFIDSLIAQEPATAPRPSRSDDHSCASRGAATRDEAPPTVSANGNGMAALGHRLRTPTREHTCAERAC